MDCPTQRIHEIICPTNLNDFTVPGIINIINNMMIHYTLNFRAGLAGVVCFSAGVCYHGSICGPG